MVRLFSLFLHETIGYGYKSRDINYHLYTWSSYGFRKFI